MLFYWANKMEYFLVILIKCLMLKLHGIRLWLVGCVRWCMAYRILGLNKWWSNCIFVCALYQQMDWTEPFHWLSRHKTQDTICMLYVYPSMHWKGIDFNAFRLHYTVPIITDTNRKHTTFAENSIFIFIYFVRTKIDWMKYH